MKALALLWAVVVIAVGCFVALRTTSGIPVETRVLSMLPPGSVDPVAAAAETRITQSLTRRLLVLLGHTDRDRVRAAAAATIAAFVERKIASPERASLEADELAPVLQRFAAHAPQLLSRLDRDDLLNGRADALVARAMGRVMLPLQPVDGAVLQQDPLLLSAAFLADLPRPSGRLAPHGAFLEGRDGERHIALIVLRLGGDPFAASTQNAVTAIIDNLRHGTLRADAGFALQAAGPVLYAEAGTRDAITDLSRLGIANAVVLIGILFATFRGIGAILLIALPVIIGILVGLAATIAVFPAIHSLAVVFGTTLVGIAVDYAIHYMAGWFAVDGASARLRLVLTGTALGLMTTLIGYAAILASPFPALQQLAVFSLAGLTAAWLTMVLWLPRLDRAPHRPLPGFVVPLFSYGATHARRFAVAGVVLGGVLALVGLARFDTTDDLRRFQSLAPELRLAEAEIRRVTGLHLAPLVLTVVAQDEEAALRLEEKVAERLRAQGIDAETVARYAPSAARQQENLALLRGALPRPAPGQLAPMLERRLDQTLEPLAPDLLPQVFQQRIADLRTATADGRIVHILHVLGGADHHAVEAAIAGLEDIALLDLPARFGEGFAAQRRHTLVLLGLLAAAAFGIASWRYGSRHGAVTALPPVLAALLTPLLLAAAGEPFSFFNAVGLLLVIGLGIDYAFYWAEGVPAHRKVTALAVTLSTLTTVVSFGLLVFSRTEALGGFGATVAIGTLLSAVLAPLAARRRA